MYEIELYQDAKGKCPVQDWMQSLDRVALSNKDAAIQLRQVLYQIERLRTSGPHVGTAIAKHIDGPIWEIRPGKNRVLFAAWHGNKIVLLHVFRNTTTKTLLSEIERAKRNLQDWLDRKE